MKLTKTAIRAALRHVYKRMDCTGLFKLYFQLTGKHGRPNSANCDMVEYFEPFCTSERMLYRVSKLCDSSYAHFEHHRYDGPRHHVPTPADGRLTALRMLRRLATEPVSSYSKVPFKGLTHLYFCSPAYGHSDYNKVRTCLMNGPLQPDPASNCRADVQAAFCDKVFDLGRRIYNRKLAECSAE